MWYAFIMTVKTWILLYAGTMLFTRLVGKEDAEWVKGKPLGIMMGYYAVGMFGHTYWLAYLMMIATLPVLAKSRGEAAALFMVATGSITELNNPLTIGGTYLLFIDKWTCLSIGFAIVLFMKPRFPGRTSTRFDVPFLIMLVLELVQARNLGFTATLRASLGTLLSEGLPYFALVLSIGRMRDLRRLMLAVIYLGFNLSIIAVYEAFTRQFVYLVIDSQLNSAGLALYRLNKVRGGILRAPTSFAEPTSFAQFLVIVLMTALVYRPYFRSTRKLTVALALISFGIFVTSTRNAWIAVLLGVLAFDLYRRRYVSFIGKAAALGILYGTLMLLAQFVPYFSAMTGNSADTSGTADYRMRLLTRGIEEFQKHPLVGTDIMTIIANMQDMVQGEGIVDFVNGYLFYALTAGIGGLIGLVLVFVLPCIAMLSIRRAMTRRHVLLERTAAFVFAINVSYFVCTAFTGIGGRGSLFFYETLAIGAVIFSWRTVSRERLLAWDRGGRPRSEPEAEDDQVVAVPA